MCLKICLSKNLLLYKTSLKIQTWSFRNGKGNSVVTVQRQDYLKKKNDILSDQRKFGKVSLKDDAFLNFAINQEKPADKVLKKLVESKSMTDKTRTSLKAVGTRPGIMYRSCKLHKASIGNCLPFWPILLALNTCTYKLAKLLAPILKPLTRNEFTVKRFFPFCWRNYWLTTWSLSGLFRSRSRIHQHTFRGDHCNLY